MQTRYQSGTQWTLPERYTYWLENYKKNIPRLNEDICKNHLDEMNLSELKGIFDKASGRRNYEINDDVTDVLNGLKANNWIYEYLEDERNAVKYVVTKK